MQPAEALKTNNGINMGTNTAANAPDAQPPIDRQALEAQLAEARVKLEALAQELRAVDDELEKLATDRRQHRLALEICGRLDELTALGGAQLFWGDSITAGAGVEHVNRV